MKKRVIAVVLMLAMLISTFGVTAFAAEVPANGELAVAYEIGSGQIVISLSATGELTEFQYTVEFGEDLQDADNTVAYAFTDEFKQFASSNKAQTACGIPADAANKVTFGGVFGNPSAYEGAVATVTVEKAAVAAGGVTVKVYNGSEMVYQMVWSANCMLGDVDENGKVEASDALKTLQAVVRLVELTDAQTTAADVDGNDKVEAVDALYILQMVVKLIDTFPAER